LLLICLLCIIGCGRVEALYFLLTSERKCFHVEQPGDTPIVFNYEILDAGHLIDFELSYGQSEVPNEDSIIMKRQFDTATGHIDFITDASGYFTYCLKQVKSDDVSTRFKLLVSYGFDDEYYEKLSEEQKIDVVNTETHKINDLLLMTINEADYQKHKEVKYHTQTERMNRTVLWWPMLQIGILVITGIFQVQHLKNFFKNNKLI